MYGGGEGCHALLGVLAYGINWNRETMLAGGKPDSRKILGHVDFVFDDIQCRIATHVDQMSIVRWYPRPRH